MKYFTKQLWIDAQQPGEAGQDAGRRYEGAFAAYARELESLRPRLAADAFGFFESADVHDGAMLHLRLGQGTSEPAEQRRLRLVAVELAVREWSGTLWTLRYADVRRVLVDFPSDDPLFYSPGDGFEDWGYHELSDAGEGFLRHKVLFSSGSIVLLEFRDISVERIDAPSLPTVA